MRLLTNTSILLCLILLSFGCEKESINEVVLFEPGVLSASASTMSILAGETVTFTDSSTKVHERAWSFPGGVPETSTDAEVTVTYPRGGTYAANLQVKYIDNQTQRESFSIEVEGVEVTSFGFYTEDSAITPGSSISLEENNAYVIENVLTDPYEGTEALRFRFDAQDTWGVMGAIRPPTGETVDISQFAEGFYNLALKSTSDKKMLIRLQGGGQNAIITLDPAEEPYGFVRDGNWHFISIPIADFLSNNPAVDLAQISHLLVLRSGEPSVASTDDWDFFVDNFYLTE